MPASNSKLDSVAALVQELDRAGFGPILIGGMALIVLGSQRVTMDFDLLVTNKDPHAVSLVKIMYGRHFELITKFKPDGEVLRTVDNSRVAAAKLKIEKPDSLLFYNWDQDLRVDLLLDFPVPAQELSARAAKVSTPKGPLRVAAPEDLLKLKEIAARNRKSGKDAQDLEFLKALLRRRRDRSK